jgi:hypothetical protein
MKPESSNSKRKQRIELLACWTVLSFTTTVRRAYTAFHQMLLFWSLIIQRARNADFGISRSLYNQAPKKIILYEKQYRSKRYGIQRIPSQRKVSHAHEGNTNRNYLPQHGRQSIAGT